MTVEPCSVPCNLCGGVEVKTLATKNRNGGPLRTVVCSRCGLVWSDPQPYNPREYYEKEYRLSYKGTFAPKPKHIFRGGRVALSRYAAIRRFLPEHGTVLDVGTGGGEFLYLLHKAGFRARGIEPNTGYAEYSAEEYGLDIWNGFVQDAVLPADSIDMITVWHVLEHTEDPFQVLTRLRDSLTPDGVLIIEVPNIEAVCQSPSHTFHEAHMYNFNPVTLGKIAQKSGLPAIHESVSPDGGNIFLVCKKDGRETPPESRGSDAPGNAGKITRIVQGHVNYKYRFSLTPYKRLFGRIGRVLGEWRGLRGFTNGKTLLDSMFSPVTEKCLFYKIPEL